MTLIRGVQFYDGQRFTGQTVNLWARAGSAPEVVPTVSQEDIDSAETVVDGAGLIALPAGIDPHVHFRTPGHEHKENWKTGPQDAIYGGYTTVCDMPNTNPPCTNEAALTAKDERIRQQLAEAGLGHFHYRLYLGGDRTQFSEIAKVKDRVVAIKVYMGSSTGNLLMDDEPSLRRLFEIARDNNLLVAVHAEDEAMICQRKQELTSKEFSVHSEIRNCEVAEKATKLAIKLTKEIGNRLYIVHVSTKGEIDLIRAAKREGLKVYAEATPHHIFLNTGHYHDHHGRAQVNPPLRPAEHNQALLDAIKEGVIDTIGSDHAPHTIEEKDKMYGECPSGLPGIATTMSLLLDAYSKKDAHSNPSITLQKIVDLTHNNPRKIFGLPVNSDLVLVDLNRVNKVEGAKLFTKCKWSPYEGMKLKGAPVLTILEGQTFDPKGQSSARIKGKVTVFE